MPIPNARPIPKIACLLLCLFGQLCTVGSASEVRKKIKTLDIGTYVEGTHFVDGQKRRFRGYVNRTQGYAVTLVTPQLPHRQRIIYQSIDRLRVKNTQKIAVQFNPQARRFLTRTGVAIGRRAAIGMRDTDHGFAGIIASVTDSSLILATTHKRDEYKTLTASELGHMSINLGRTSHIKKGVKAGFATGFCIGVIFSSSDLDNSDETGWSAVANIVLNPETAIFSLIGAGIGGIIGKLASHETWQAVPLDRLSFTRPHPSLSLSASYSF